MTDQDNEACPVVLGEILDDWSDQQFLEFWSCLRLSALDQVQRFPVVIEIIDRDHMDASGFFDLMLSRALEKELTTPIVLDTQDQSRFEQGLVSHITSVVVAQIRKKLDEELWKNKSRPGPRSIDPRITGDLEQAIWRFHDAIDNPVGVLPEVLYSIGLYIQRYFYYDPDIWDIWHVAYRKLGGPLVEESRRENKEVARILNDDTCSNRRDWTADQVREKRQSIDRVLMHLKEPTA